MKENLLPILGIPYSINTCSPKEFSWDGATLHEFDSSGRAWSDLKIFHEIGHWVCAQPYLRHLPDFGCYCYEQELTAYIVGEIARISWLNDRRGPMPKITDQVDQGAFARGTSLLEKAGIKFRKEIVLDPYKIPI